MGGRIWASFGHWYIISLDIFLILGIYCFLKLSKKDQMDRFYRFPFFVLCYIVFCANLAAYTNFDFDFKKTVNAYLGNTEYPMFNLWLINVTERQILTILNLFLIKSWLEPSKKKYIDWMVLIFVITAIILQVTKVELMYLEQPIIFAIGANMILFACGLYFIGLITNEKYLQSNPLRLLSFWKITFLLFNYSLTYVSSVSLLYLYRENPSLGRILFEIGTVLTIMNTSIFVLLVAAPFLAKYFDREPYHASI